jgi:hypothetical protein
MAEKGQKKETWTMRHIGTVVLVIAVAAVIGGVIWFARDDGAHEAERDRDALKPQPLPKDESPCNTASATERDHWLQTPTELRPDHATPASLGYRIIGDCSRTIVETRLDCPSLMQLKDDPFVVQAITHGFTTYMCEVGGTDQRVVRDLRNLP